MKMEAAGSSETLMAAQHYTASRPRHTRLVNN